MIIEKLSPQITITPSRTPTSGGPGQGRVEALNRTLNRHAAKVLGRIVASEREHVRRALALVRTALREELGAGDKVLERSGSPEGDNRDNRE